MLTWNRLKKLRKTLDSFHRYNGDKFKDHMYIVDNGSKDGTHEYLKKTGLHVMTNETNEGAQAGKYKGWTEAMNRGYEYLIFIEDDFPSLRDIPIKKLEAYLDEHKEVGYIRLNDKKTRKTHKVTKLRHNYWPWFKYKGEKMRKSDYHFTSNPTIFRTSLVPHMGGAETEVDYMRSYLGQYDYMCFLNNACFKTVIMKRQKGWSN